MTGFDCQSCGACCSTTLWDITVDPTDSTPRYLTVPFPAVLGYAGYDAAAGVRRMISEGDQCVALRGQIGLAVHCSCYGRRPEACDAFAAGSDDCLVARQTLGIDPVPLTP